MKKKENNRRKEAIMGDVGSFREMPRRQAVGALCRMESSLVDVKRRACIFRIKLNTLLASSV